MHLIHSAKRRRAVRRAVSKPCVAVATDRYRLLGQKVLDLSTRGMLVRSVAPVELGDEVFVSFQTPGDGKWMNARSEVTRIVRGKREGDRGPCVGLRFTDLDAAERGELLARLAGIPPTIPQRSLRRTDGLNVPMPTFALPLVTRKHVAPLGVWARAA